ncbi:hypothetical protein [Aquiflexum sp.]
MAKLQPELNQCYTGKEWFYMEKEIWRIRGVGKEVRIKEKG